MNKTCSDCCPWWCVVAFSYLSVSLTNIGLEFRINKNSYNCSCFDLIGYFVHSTWSFRLNKRPAQNQIITTISSQHGQNKWFIRSVVSVAFMRLPTNFSIDGIFIEPQGISFRKWLPHLYLSHGQVAKVKCLSMFWHFSVSLYRLSAKIYFHVQKKWQTISIVWMSLTAGFNNKLLNRTINIWAVSFAVIDMGECVLRDEQQIDCID